MNFKNIGLGTTANDGTGDDLRTAGQTLNDNFTIAVENKTLIVPAAAMLPMTTASAYYLESDDFPSQVFSATANQYCKFQLFDIGNQIPSWANAFKIKFISIGVNTTGTDVVWSAAAVWANIGDASVASEYGTAVTVIEDAIATEELVVSDQSGAITPAGTKTAGCGLWIKIGRLSEDANDDFASPAKLVWVEIEFVTV
jgi:hypothetical protein